MANIGYIETHAKQPTPASLSIPTDESIGGMLFDISGFTDPFKDFPLIYHNFKNGAIQCIHNMDEAQILGIENNAFLNGMLYYHLSRFFEFMGSNHPIYVCLADCSEDWDAIQAMQQETSGKLFQIGIWTSQSIWNVKEDGSLGFTPLITDLQAQTNEVNGKLGESTHSMVPLSLVLFGNSVYVKGKSFTFKELPDAMELKCPKVSVILAQNGSSEIISMQGQNPNQAPVGIIGIVMALLASIGAEESIAALEKCDLNQFEGFNNPQWAVGSSGTPISDVHRIWANIISSRGYIVPIDFEGAEASYFLSSDQTLMEGDFGTIANNRVMHKCRRAMSTALIPYLHSNHIYMPATKNISPSALAMITDSIYTLMDSVMRNRQGKQQISERTVSFIENPDMIDNDSLFVKLEVGPVNYSSTISEEVSHDVG